MARVLRLLWDSPLRGLSVIALALPYVVYMSAIDIENRTAGLRDYLAWGVGFLLTAIGIWLLIHDNRGARAAARRARDVERSKQPWDP